MAGGENGGARISQHGHGDVDRQLTPTLRVREWEQRFVVKPRWPACAHPAVEVAWVDHGEISYFIGRREHVLGPDEAMLVPSGVEHRNVVASGTRAGSLWLGPELIDQIADAIGLSSSSRLEAGLLPTAPRIVRLGRHLIEEAAQGGPGQALAADALAEALVVDVVRGLGEVRRAPTIRDTRINAALDQVETCFAEPLTVDELAQTAGMSRFHFSRLFREQVGASPYQYLQQRRIANAARLLRRGGCSVTEAAMTVGITELGRFSQTFRRQIGCAPSEYLRAAR